MRYFPLDRDRFEHQFGVRALGESEPFVEPTEHYAAELSLKRKQLNTQVNDYFRALPDTLPAQREAFDFLSASASFLGDGSNRLTAEPIVEDTDQPLLAIARHVQEDLAVVGPDAAAGYPLVAGAICFPSGWCVGDKLGMSMLGIHDPVPEFRPALGTSTVRLMDRLKPGRPVWRTNWGVRPSGQLDQSPVHAERLRARQTEVTADNAGTRCFFRVERQTLARLPETNHILFTIHTHQCPLRELDRLQQQILLGVIRTCPDPTLRYKGIFPMRREITGFLASNHSNSGGG